MAIFTRMFTSLRCVPPNLYGHRSYYKKMINSFLYFKYFYLISQRTNYIITMKRIFLRHYNKYIIMKPIHFFQNLGIIIAVFSCFCSCNKKDIEGPSYRDGRMFVVIGEEGKEITNIEFPYQGETRDLCLFFSGDPIESVDYWYDSKKVPWLSSSYSLESMRPGSISVTLSNGDIKEYKGVYLDIQFTAEPNNSSKKRSGYITFEYLITRFVFNVKLKVEQGGK